MLEYDDYLNHTASFVVKNETETQKTDYMYIRIFLLADE